MREERESESKDGRLIDEYIREGRIVPVNISLGLLQRAMEKGGPFSRFLIDGFPRNSDNVKVGCTSETKPWHPGSATKMQALLLSIFFLRSGRGKARTAENQHSTRNFLGVRWLHHVIGARRRMNTFAAQSFCCGQVSRRRPIARQRMASDGRSLEAVALKHDARCNELKLAVLLRD